VEVLVSVAIIGTSFVSLYSGISMGFAIVNVARENLRATQVLQEKMETFRLYNWDQINTAGFIPPTFAEPFYPRNSTNFGIVYNGTVVVANAPISEIYSSDLRMVILSVNWTSGHVLRQREMRTFVSRYGLQNYIY
jgi:type II secretory pathway pseudopilin PulG